jgi:hypothetical protein
MESLNDLARVLAVAALTAPALAAADNTHSAPASCYAAVVKSLPRGYAPAARIEDSRSYAYSPLEFMDLHGPTAQWAMTARDERNNVTVAHLVCTVSTSTGEVISLRNEP